MVPGVISAAVSSRAYNPGARVFPLVLSASSLYRQRRRPVLHQPHPDPLSSTQLLARLRTGDDDAFTLLMERYLVPLRRWAHGRLPTWARSMSDTQDLVQDAIVRVLRNLATFEPERSGALHGYLRTAIMHRIVDELRHAHRVPKGVSLDDNLISALPSPYEQALKQEDRDLFEAALAELREEDRELIIGRVEWDLSYDDLATALGKPTANAARVGTRRAVLRLAEIMNRKRHPRPE
jgi:RNA polymerase sigma factor (sigma-70 family)